MTLQTYILLDRSGSMSSKWDETVSSVNAYAAELAKDGATKDSLVSLACFDGFHGVTFDVLRDAVPANAWGNVDQREVSPRGNTPLYDAIGKLVARAEAASPDKAVLVIVTDGNENASREMTKDSAKAALDRARGRNWQVIFLAAEFDNFAQASGLGNAAAQTINTAAGSRVATMASTARMTAAYAASGRAMLYGDDDYKTASGSGR
jgi:uncharacterized protein YegL